MADSAADVPTKYDVLIDGLGYIFADDTDSPYFSRHSTYTQTPTFLERQNISGNYGDNNQAFYMVLTQHNWAEGDYQRFIDVNNQDSLAKAYRIIAADPRSSPGQLTSIAGVNSGILAFSSSNALRGVAAAPTEPKNDDTAYTTLSGNVYFANDDGLYQYNIRKKAFFLLGGTWTKTKQLVGILALGGRVANSGTGIGYSEKVLVGNQLWTPGAVTGAFTTFLDTPEPGPMALLNNLVYAFDGTTLRVFDSTGVSTILYQMKDGYGNLSKGEPGQIVAAGGVLYFLLAHNEAGGGSELWQYDGSSAHIVLKLPDDATAYYLVQSQGILFIGGYVTAGGHASTTNVADFPLAKQTVWAYDGSNFSIAWQSPTWTTAPTGRTLQSPCQPICAYSNGIVIQAIDNIYGSDLLYIDVDGVSSSIGDYTSLGGTTNFMLNVEGTLFHCQGGVSSSRYNEFPSNRYAKGRIDSSLFDGGSNLQKYWKSITVEWIGSGTVDIYYTTDLISYTQLQVAATSGTEYTLGVTAQALGYKLFLNENTALDPTSIPTVTLRRVTLKGVPILDTFRRNSYLLDLSGNKRADPPQHVICRNNQPHPLDGQDMATNLRTSMLKKTPITIVDRFGTFTGVIEPDQTTYEEVRQDYGRGEFKGTIVVREV